MEDHFATARHERTLQRRDERATPEFLIDDITVDAASEVPEPAVAGLLAAALVALGAAARRRRAV